MWMEETCKPASEAPQWCGTIEHDGVIVAASRIRGLSPDEADVPTERSGCHGVVIV
ncbi:hypothetical protein GCM10010532_093770 [Dactylosporangium siamense]|uniref:Uncharacterized protein n=1 Tax=Dactylosporangium siamense TaxID=685454 RepID=A0A919UCE4_9ACTN|nr:hypothetical protein Dsi01nite_083180 [Dactylosporangium siamense]